MSSTTSVLVAVLVVVHDCFALSFLSTLDGLRDCPVQTSRVAVISRWRPAHQTERAGYRSAVAEHAKQQSEGDARKTALAAERGENSSYKRKRGGKEAEVWWRILTRKTWSSGCAGKDSEALIHTHELRGNKDKSKREGWHHIQSSLVWFVLLNAAKGPVGGKT